VKRRRWLPLLLALLVVAASSHAQEAAGTVAVPRLGLILTDVTALMARQAQLDRIKGCFVQSVLGGSPAAAAGLRAGDIIVSFNGRGIRNARELKNDVASVEAGAVGKVCVVRDDYRTTLYVTPAGAPERDARHAGLSPWLGVDVVNVEPESTESSRLEEAGKEGGVLVEKVIEGSPADQAGIEPGDVIMSFNSRKVRTVEELSSDLLGAEVGTAARICVMRGEIRKTLHPVLGRRPDPSYGLTSYEGGASAEPGTLLTKPQLAAVFPDASRFLRYLQPVPHYRAFGRSDDDLGVAFVTTEVCPEESQGYHGPISTLVGLSRDGKIVGVRLLEHWESPKYLKDHLDAFVEQYPGRDAGGPFVLGRDIDAITGATITSSAINHSIAVGSAIVLLEVLKTEGSAAVAVQSGGISLEQILGQPDSALLLVIAVLALAGYYRRDQTIRYVVLGMSLLYVGYLKGGGFSIHDALNILQGDLPLLGSNIYWYGLLALTIVTTVLIGRFYCGWLCPFGALTEMLYRLFPSLKVDVPARTDRWLRLFKYLVLLAILLAALVLGQRRDIGWFLDIVEPFGTAFQLAGTRVAWFVVTVYLAGSILISRVYCRYFCPLGAFLAMVAMAASWVRRVVGRAAGPAPHPRAWVGRCPVGAMGQERYYSSLGTTNGECIVCVRRAG
jgi:NosR/NirI family nitrous oxide reductase transcriptional regulator